VYPAAVSLGASEKFAQTPAIREQSLLKKVAAVYGGDLREAEAILTAQALALNAIFTEVERDDAPRRKRMSDVESCLIVKYGSKRWHRRAARTDRR
jgi:hypothetical protein